MTTPKSSPVDARVLDLYGNYAAGQVDRRTFMAGAVKLGIAGVAASALGSLDVSPGRATLLAAQAAGAAGIEPIALDLAEWSYFWVNVKRADTARGSFVGGQQMYVEYMVPARVTQPYPVVLVHGGGGQGLDWMGTPDGRPGWFQILASMGYRVYVVDRPGHGRSPQHPDLLGEIPARPGTMEAMQGQFIFPAPTNTDPYRKNHTQWPGQGVPGSPDVAQFVASQGGSYVVAGGGAGGGGRGGAPAGAPGAGGRAGGAGGPGAGGGAPGGGRQGGGPGGGGAPGGGAGGAAGGGAQAGGGGGRGGAAAGPPQAANQQAAGQPNLAHMAWREGGAELLDKIGPAIIITHSAGGSFGLLVAEARPKLVKATVMIEGGGTGFSAGNRWGMSTIPVTWDPPVQDPSEIKVRYVASPEPDVDGYFLQEEPARKLPNWRDVAVLTVTSAAGQASPGNPGAPAFLKQAGVLRAEELRLASAGIQGNSHMMMVEKNHRQVLDAILTWVNRNVSGKAPAVRKRGVESTALKLANTGYFWAGANVEKKDYGTVVIGQMFVQYLIPSVVRQPLPIVLVHGGGGQMTHYMGLDGNAGWAHYYAQAGYKVYLVDRPGHGRSPVSLEALGPLGVLPMHASVTVDFMRAASGTPRRWSGTGDVGDPLVDQFMAGQNAAPTDNALMQTYWRRAGADLLDRIGPAIIQTHSAGGPFGWLVAAERPALAKAVVCFEGAGLPTGADNAPLPLNLKGVEVLYLTADNSGRTNGPSIVTSLSGLGASATHLNLKERNIAGNGHFAMLETNRKEVFDVLRGWIESKFPATGAGARA